MNNIKATRDSTLTYLAHAGLFLLLMLFSLSPYAEEAEEAEVELYLTGERPDTDGPPTPITVGIYLMDIDEIDDVNQRFSVDMFVTISWQDPRLALPEENRKDLIRRFSVDDIWTPRGFVVNDRGLSSRLPRMVDVDDLGNVNFQQRLIGELAVDMVLKEFPFDRQYLPIDIVSYQNSINDIRFSLNTDISGDDGSFSEEGWRFRIMEPEIGEFKVPSSRKINPRLTYYIEAKRNLQYYLVTMFLPMTLIVFMSWMAFWLQPNLVPPRIAVSTASIFTLIAFGFSIRLSLPPVSYMTRADLFVIGCTIMVFIALAVSVVGSRWANAERLEDALKLNRLMRWAYIGLFALVAATAMLI